MANYWNICCSSSLLYSAVLHSRADSLHSHVILHEWIVFYGAFLNIHQNDTYSSDILCSFLHTSKECYKKLYLTNGITFCHQLMPEYLQKQTLFFLAEPGYKSFWPFLASNGGSMLGGTLVEAGWFSKVWECSIYPLQQHDLTPWCSSMLWWAAVNISNWTLVSCQLHRVTRSVL